MDRKSRLYSYISATIKNKKCTLIDINGMEEHVHLLIDLNPTVALSDLIKLVKQSSSRWISDSNLFPFYEGWASEYYACSVSPGHVDAVKRYIENQREHHEGKDYGQEMQEFVNKMGMKLYTDN